MPPSEWIQLILAILQMHDENSKECKRNRRGNVEGCKVSKEKRSTTLDKRHCPLLKRALTRRSVTGDSAKDRLR